MSNGAGKGDRYRPVNNKKYGDNYDRIFGYKGFRIGDKVRVKVSPPGADLRVIGFRGGKIVVRYEVSCMQKEFWPSELELNI